MHNSWREAKASFNGQLQSDFQKHVKARETVLKKERRQQKEVKGQLSHKPQTKANRITKGVTPKKKKKPPNIQTPPLFLGYHIRLFLPVPSVPGTLGHIRQAVLDSGANVGQAVTDRTTDAASSAVDGLA